jgi:hypothetical protein
MTMPDRVRVYLPTSVRAHLLPVSASPNVGYPVALCGLQPRWGESWRGTGTQAEWECAAELPLCRGCEARTGADIHRI